jgi:sensor histidine kinase YesM
MAHPRTVPRTWVWLQLIIGWLPVWALYTLLVSPLNPLHGGTPFRYAMHSGLLAVGIAALLGLGVYRLTQRIPWPHPFRAGFIGLHLLAAAIYSLLCLGLKGAVELLLHQQSALVFQFFFLPSFVLGIWLYVMVAGVSYATQATERAARAEASAARSQLTALRGQLNPHFLFNALHTVVQLIPRDPRQAAHAAEQIAGLLRTTLEEDRDIVTLAEERGFVER